MRRYSRGGVLVTGADGQVGRALQSRIPDARYASRTELDVTDAAAVERAAESCDIVIHLAAMTNVDRCEQRPDDAALVNVTGTTNVVRAARAAGARVVYLSTDYVFSGDLDGEYEENDDPGPINVYGRTKLDGERAVGEDPRNLIVRSSWIFGDGRNFVRAILERAGDPELEVVDDQRGRPTGAEGLAQALAFLVERAGAGIVHVAGDGDACTWADLADHALELAGVERMVTRVTSAHHAARAPNKVAPRPATSVLSLRHARELGVPLLDWRVALESYVKEIA